MPYISPPPSKFKWMSPALPSYSLLPPLLSPAASTLCNSALFVADPIFRFDPSCGFEADCGAADWLTDRHKGTPTSWHGCFYCAHYRAHPPLCENEPITLRLLVPNPAPFLCLYGSRHTHIYTLHPSCSSTTPFTVWSEEGIGGSSIVSLIRFNRVGCWASTTTWHLPLSVTYGQEQTWEIHHARKAEATLWRVMVREEAEDVAWQLSHLSHCIISEWLDPPPESIFGNQKWLLKSVRLNAVILV